MKRTDGIHSEEEEEGMMWKGQRPSLPERRLGSELRLLVP